MAYLLSPWCKFPQVCLTLAIGGLVRGVFQMRDRRLGAAAWMAFVIIAGICFYLMLAACDLGIRPLFGLHYCTAHATPDRLADQRALERDLRAQIHEAQLGLARLPA